MPSAGGLIDGVGYTPIFAGSSYIQAVSWKRRGPDARALVTYSQSTDPASEHYADMTRLYSGKGWNDMPYCPADIEAEKTSQTEISTQ